MNKKRSVVIVDDSPVTSGQLVTFFNSKMDFKVVALGVDGNAAIDLYKIHKPDLITMDVTMPNKDGYHASVEILNEFPDANILIISALQGDMILRCLAAGAKGYVTKPVKLHDEARIKDMIKTINGIFNSDG